LGLSLCQREENAVPTREPWLALLAVLLLPSVALSADPPILSIGAPAPDFDLPGVDGKNHRLQDFANANLLVVVFTCNHCPTAQAYESRIQKLADDYLNRGVALVAISPNDPLALRLDELGYTDMSDTLDEMKIRARDRSFTFPYLYDGETQQVSKAYGPVATPHVFIFDRERRLRYAGRVDDSENPARITAHDTRNAIESLLAGKPVPVETTKTFGCSIKWADKRSSAKVALEHWSKEEVGLQTIDEKGIRELLRNDSDKVRLVNVWATWCGPCVAEFPELVTIHRMYRGRKFELITISADAPGQSAEALAFLRKQQASSRNFIFHEENKYKLVEAVDEKWPGALPHTLIVEPGGKVIYRQTGEFSPMDLRKAIVGRLGRYYFQPE
jgi:peroxiredoxin